MREFNAFQAVVLFAIWPFLIGWPARGPFPFSFGVMWLAIVAYAIGFIAMCASVVRAMSD